MRANGQPWQRMVGGSLPPQGTTGKEDIMDQKWDWRRRLLFRWWQSRDWRRVYRQSWRRNWKWRVFHVLLCVVTYMVFQAIIANLYGLPYGSPGVAWGTLVAVFLVPWWFDLLNTARIQARFFSVVEDDSRSDAEIERRRLIYWKVGKLVRAHRLLARTPDGQETFVKIEQYAGPSTLHLHPDDVIQERKERTEGQ